MHEENASVYPENIIKIAQDLKHFGRMNPALSVAKGCYKVKKGGVNDPIYSACIKGPCGDEMEFYLVIKDKVIENVKFYTKGCIATKVCGSMTAQLVLGKSVDEALSISPRKVIEALNGLPEDHCHCSILAVSTLYRAIANYLLKE